MRDVHTDIWGTGSPDGGNRTYQGFETGAEVVNLKRSTVLLS